MGKSSKHGGMMWNSILIFDQKLKKLEVFSSIVFLDFYPTEASDSGDATLQGTASHGLFHHPATWQWKVRKMTAKNGRIWSFMSIEKLKFKI